MSVPEGERTESKKFTLPLAAEFLARYTLNITKNENVFLPDYQRALTDDIIETAKNIYLGVREANDVSVRVGTIFHEEDYKERNRLQRKALRDCKRLLYLIDLSKRVFHLSSKRVKYWGDKTTKVRNRISKWIEDDNTRFAP